MHNEKRDNKGKLRCCELAAGAILGHGLCTALAVVGGNVLAKRISERVVLVLGGSPHLQHKTVCCSFAFIALTSPFWASSMHAQSTPGQQQQTPVLRCCRGFPL